MKNDITERFIINMYVRGMKISEIANTVNITATRSYRNN